MWLDLKRKAKLATGTTFQSTISVWTCDWCMIDSHHQAIQIKQLIGYFSVLSPWDGSYNYRLSKLQTINKVNFIKG